jgi:hypothetical protein
MRILFYGEDKSMRHVAESLTNVETIHCVGFNEALNTIKDWEKERGEESEIIVSVLDLSLGIESLDKFADQTEKIDGHYRCVFAYTKDLGELKSYQKTKWACDGQLLGPMSLEGLQEITSDFETVYFLDQLEEDEEIELTQLESSALKELENLDEDKEDYDTTKTGMLLPDEFNSDDNTSTQLSASPYLDKSTEDEDEEEKEPEREKTEELKAPIFHNNPTHKKIKKIFDQVFKYKGSLNSSQKSEDLELPEDDTKEEALSQSGANMAEPKDEEIGFDFDLSEEEDEIQEKSSSGIKVGKDDDDELGFAFDLDEANSDKKTPAESKETLKDEVEGLDDLDFGSDDNEEGLPSHDSTAELIAEAQTLEDKSDENEESFEFNFDDDTGDESEENSLSMAKDGEKTEAPSQEETDEEDSAGDLDFGDDDGEESEENSLSMAKEGEKTDARSQEDASEEDSPGDLDFGDNDDDGLNFELGGASDEHEQQQQSKEPENAPGDIDFDSQEEKSEENTSESDDGFGDLDFDASNEEKTDATKVATSSMSDELESSTEPGDESKDSGDESEAVENETRVFDLPDGLPAELTDDMMSDEASANQDFSMDDIQETEAKEQGDSVENTNPTVVRSTDDATNSSQENEDQPTAGFEFDNNKEEKGFYFSEDELDSNEEDEDKTVVVKRDPARSNESHSESALPKGLSAYGEDELTRLQSTIRQLREEREESHKVIQDLKKENRLIEQESLSEKAEFDELKIEISILKKRHKNEEEELRYQVKLAEEKKQIYEERCRNYQKEFERLNQKVRIEFNQVKQREKELEGQLELVSMDSEAQVQSRDSKILELKRKIDSLEFNMENVSIREQKSREDKARLEDRLTKIMSTLRGSIQLLEDEDEVLDSSVDEDTDEKI